jgi:hypothetical protein
MDANRSNSMEVETPVGNGQGSAAWPVYFFGALWLAWIFFLVLMVLSKSRPA